MHYSHDLESSRIWSRYYKGHIPMEEIARLDKEIDAIAYYDLQKLLKSYTSYPTLSDTMNMHLNLCGSKKHKDTWYGRGLDKLHLNWLIDSTEIP